MSDGTNVRRGSVVSIRLNSIYTKVKAIKLSDGTNVNLENVKCSFTKLAKSARKVCLINVVNILYHLKDIRLITVFVIMLYV